LVLHKASSLVATSAVEVPPTTCTVAVIRAPMTGQISRIYSEGCMLPSLFWRNTYFLYPVPNKNTQLFSLDACDHSWRVTIRTQRDILFKMFLHRNC
jgi:hypothetical protein